MTDQTTMRDMKTMDHLQYLYGGMSRACEETDKRRAEGFAVPQLPTMSEVLDHIEAASYALGRGSPGQHFEAEMLWLRRDERGNLTHLTATDHAAPYHIDAVCNLFMDLGGGDDQPALDDCRSIVDWLEVAAEEMGIPFETRDPNDPRSDGSEFIGVDDE